MSVLHASPAARPRTFTHLALCLALVSLGACSKPEPPPELPHLGTLPSFALTTQRGAAFGEGDFVGKLTAVNFIFTSCPTICPVIVERTRSVQAALKAGCKMVKFFPAMAAGGPNMLKNIAAPYAHTGVGFNPTGGVNMDNLGDWLALPQVRAVGGTWIAAKPDIAAGNWEKIADNARAAVARAKELRSK